MFKLAMRGSARPSLSTSYEPGNDNEQMNAAMLKADQDHNESDSQAAKLKATSLSTAVYEALRESIVTLGDPPGALLTESAVASRYGVARPTAKAALERLVAEGLLRRRAHRAAQVPTLSRADIEDLYAARVLIEEAALIDIAKRGFVPPAALHAHQEITRFSESGKDAPFAMQDLRFHQALVEGHGSPRLTRMHHLLMGEIQLCMGQLQSHQLLRAKEIGSQHQGILDAIVARDDELAGFLIRRHIRNARDRLLTRFAEKRAGQPATEDSDESTSAS